MINFIASVIAWVLLCGAAFLMMSGMASFVEMEWQWFGQSRLDRAFLFLVCLYLGTKVKWREPKP